MSAAERGRPVWSVWWAATIGLIAALRFITRLAKGIRLNRIPVLLTPLPLWMPPAGWNRDVSARDTESRGRPLTLPPPSKTGLYVFEPVFSSLGIPSVTQAAKTESALNPDESDTQPDRFSATIPHLPRPHGTTSLSIVAETAPPAIHVVIQDTRSVKFLDPYSPPAYTTRPPRTSRTDPSQASTEPTRRGGRRINRPIRERCSNSSTEKSGGTSKPPRRGSKCKSARRREQFARIQTSDPAIVPAESKRDLSPPQKKNPRGPGGGPLGRLPANNDDAIVLSDRSHRGLCRGNQVSRATTSPKDVPIDAEQRFEIHASDVDYGLAEVEIDNPPRHRPRRSLFAVESSRGATKRWREGASHRVRFRPSRMIIAGRANGTSREDARRAAAELGDSVGSRSASRRNQQDPNDKQSFPSH